MVDFILLEQSCGKVFPAVLVIDKSKVRILAEARAVILRFLGSKNSRVELKQLF